MRDELSDVLGEFSRAPHDGVRLYDFGDGILGAAVIKGDTYLTTRVCYLYVAGEGTLDTHELAPAMKVLDFGKGWFFYGVEMKLGMSTDDLRESLAEGVKKLLEAANG